MGSASRNDVVRWGAMAIYAIVVLFLVSTDSWTHCLYDHHDSATFFASGKAWMSGMVPYVDFSDSKGPLLWLIYGLGYLLSPRTVHGVFWITCVNYAFIFWWLFKTARVYLADNYRAVFASMLTALAIFYPWVRYETRAEDFALFFLVWSLYHVCRLLHDNGVDARQQTLSASLVLGASMAATLLIKYNVSAIVGVMALFVLHYAWRHGTGVWRVLGAMACSSALVLVPFVAYMLAVGCFDDFIHEYFVVNMDVVARQHALMRHPIYMLWGHRYTVGIYLLACGFSALAAAWLTPRYRGMVFVTFLATLLLTVTNAFWLYYYAICAPFVLFGLIALLQRCCTSHVNVSLCIVHCALCIMIVFAMHSAHRPAWSASDTPEQRAFDRYVDLMSQVGQPHVIYYGMHGMALGTAVHSLPACKYWVSQSGSTPAMDADQRQAIEQRRADFIFVLKTHDNPAWLHSLGYQRHPNDSHLPALMYSRCF